MIAATDILKAVDKIREKFSPDRVVLFGSYAYGTPTIDSDVDFLVVKKYRGSNLDQAVKVRLALDVKFPIDIIVRSDPEIARRVKWCDFFLQEVTTKGIILYAADNARMGREGRRRLRGRLIAPKIP